MLNLNKSTQIALALAMPASVIIAYWLYSRWSSDEEYYGKQKVVTSHNTRIKVLVPSKAVGTVIGKQGCMIKKIQAETGARLNFSGRTEENEGKPRELMISGTAETAQKAELMVYQVIADMPKILTEEIHVPYYCIGRIIGKGGATIRDLRRAAGVRIDVDKSRGLTGSDGMKDILLTGSRQQIDVAIDLIEEIVKNTEIERQEKDTTGSSKETFVPREQGSIRATAVPVEEDGQWDEKLSNGGEALGGEVNGSSESTSPLTDDFIQVMVSAVEHPGHFWVQMVSPKSLHLEQMQKDMTEQLMSEDVRENLAVTDPEPGDMVAAKFEQGDPVYYRARVLGMTSDGKVDLYFVDYGDNTYADMDTIFKLRYEFQHFPHQAVECQLANVEPLDERLGWADANITVFEDLVYCAEWKPLYAKVITYTKIQGHGDGEEILRPCMQLLDCTEQQDVDIGEELIRQGHAKRCTTQNSCSITS